MKLFFLFLSVITLFSGCSKIDYIDKNIAEIRNFLYEGKVDGVTATLVCGYRESEYVLDGYATELVEFGVLTFDIAKIDENRTQNAKFTIQYGDNFLDGDLVKNPFDNTLVVDLKKIIDVDKVVVHIIMDDNNKEISLVRLDKDWEFSSEDVKKIISKEFKEEIKPLIVDGVFKGEVYIKILNDADIYKGDYYWYVSIIGQNGGRLNAIISPKTGQILSSNNTINKTP